MPRSMSRDRALSCLNTVGGPGVVPGRQLWKARVVTHTLAVALWGPRVWMHWCGCLSCRQLSPV